MARLLVALLVLGLFGALLVHHLRSRRAPAAPAAGRAAIDHRSAPNTSIRGAEAFVRFSPEPPLGFDLEHPGNWHVGIDRGRSRDYSQVIVQGPRNPDNTYNVTAAFLTAPLQAGMPYSSLESLRAATLKPFASGAEARLISENAAALLSGVPAYSAEGVFEVTVPISATEARRVLVRRTDILCERAGKLYRISLSCDAAEDARWRPVLQRMLASFRWTD